MYRLLTILFLLIALHSFGQFTPLTVKPEYQNGIKVPRLFLKRVTGTLQAPADTTPQLILDADTVKLWSNGQYRSLGGGGTSTIINTGSGFAIIDTVQATGLDTIIAVYTGSAIVSGVQTMTLNGSGYQFFRQPTGSNYTFIYYGDAPEGQIVFKLALVGAISNSTDSTNLAGGGNGGGNNGGGGTDTTTTIPITTGNSLWAYTIDTSCQINYGGQFALATPSANMVAMANTGVSYLRSGYDGSGTPVYPTYTAGGYKVFVTYNPSTPAAGNYTALPTDSLAWRNSIKSLFTSNGITNVPGVTIIKEIGNIQHGLGYWNPGSAKNVINLLKSGANALHEMGVKAYPGSLTGQILYYEVWKDYITRGYPDSAASFAARAFPTSININTWQTDSAYGYRITFMDSIIAALPTLPLDGMNLPFTETVLDKDSFNTSINPLTFQQIARYLHRVSGKPVISLELGTNNNSSVDIMSQMIDAAQQLHDLKNGDMSIVIWRADKAANTDGSLNSYGKALQQKITEQNITAEIP